MEEQSANLNSIEKALKILVTLAAHEQGMGTSDISEELKLTMPTASRLLRVLSENGFVQKQPEGKKYVLGKAALDMGRSAYKHLGAHLAAIGKPFVDDLRDAAGESAILEIMVGDSALLVYRANGPHAVGVAVTEGMVVPAHASPGTKAILAYSPPDVVERFLKGNLSRFTEKTITNPEMFRKNLREIRQKGVAFANGEYNLEIAAMAAPIFNAKKEAIAAVVITMPMYRSSSRVQSKLTSLIKATAQIISDKLARDGI